MRAVPGDVSGTERFSDIASSGGDVTVKYINSLSFLCCFILFTPSYLVYNNSYFADLDY